MMDGCSFPLSLQSSLTHQVQFPAVDLARDQVLTSKCDGEHHVGPGGVLVHIGRGLRPTCEVGRV